MSDENENTLTVEQELRRLARVYRPSATIGSSTFMLAGADRIAELERQLAEARKDLELLSQPEAIRHEMLKEAMKDTERLEGFIDRIQAMTRHQSAHFICERINDFKEQKGQDDE